jgi:serine protease Do
MMTFKNRTNLVIFGLVVCFLIGLGIGISVDDSAEFSFVRAEDRGGQAADARADTATLPVSVNPALLAMRERGWSFSGVAPAVVNISSIRIVQEQVSRGPFFSDPFFDFFGRRFYSVPRERRERSLGSGVIVSPDGIVITNNHVVEEAAEVQVYLADGREIDAKLVGTDPATDLAVLKIDGHDFPTIPFGNSDSADIGDVVLALGNPFGLGQTVTMGIISAKGRANVGLVDYEDFIQTDAAINPGNSGGPLVNINGKLIGINTAIASRSGGFQGIGFAVPSNMAFNVMTSLLKEGKVVRGWLGVTIQNVTQDLAKAMGFSTSSGALVGDVVADSPADKAGLKSGDLITAVDGKTIKSTSQLRNYIAESAPGTIARVTILRDGKEQTLDVTLGEMPSEIAAGTGKSAESELLGFTVAPLTDEIRNDLGLDQQVHGVVVASVNQGSPAYMAGVRQGDVIQSVNRQPVESPHDFYQIVEQKKKGDSLLLSVYRGNGTFFIAFTLS